jgi:hypothetical protein
MVGATTDVRQAAARGRLGNANSPVRLDELLFPEWRAGPRTLMILVRATLKSLELGRPCPVEAGEGQGGREA